MKKQKNRRKWKKEEFISAIEHSGFSIIDTMLTDEKDREKEWIGFICKG